MNVARPQLQARMKAIFEENDMHALLSPTLIAPPPKLGMVDEVLIDGAAMPLFEAFTARALIASVAAVPAVSVPFGDGPEGLPLSIELVGAAGQDRALLAVARTLEGIAQWPIKPR